MLTIIFIWFCAIQISLCHKNIFYASNNISFNVNSTTVTYHDAVKQCKNINMTLAHIKNKSIQSQLVNSTNILNISTPFFIGLKLTHKWTFRWENGDIKVPDILWNETMINTNNDMCAYLNNTLVNLGPCSLKLGFICSNTLLEIPKKLKMCPKGFFEFSNRCYQYTNGCHDEKFNWTEASNYCHNNSDTQLMIVDSFVEQELLNTIMSTASQPSWLGLKYRLLAPNLHTWINPNSKIMPKYIINFKDGEPNNIEKENCLMSYHRLNDVGRVNDELCSKSIGFICQTKPFVYVESQNNKSNILFNQNKCRQGFFHYNQTCYKIYPESKIPVADKSICNNQPAIIHNKIDASYLRSLMNHLGVEAIQVNISHNINNPKDWFELPDMKKPSNGHCYVIFSKNKSIIECADVSKLLHVTLSGVCHYYLDDHEKLNKDLLCPPVWHKVTDKCIHIEQNMIQTFSDSQKLCQSKFNGQLATLNSMKQVNAVRALSQQSRLIWIGLSGESYLQQKWIDGTPIDYCLFRHTSNFSKDILKGEQSNRPLCFALRSHKGEWDDKLCSNLYSFACQIKAFKNPCPTTMQYYINGVCYHASSSHTNSWMKANSYCQSVHPQARIAMFNSSQQMELLFSQLALNNSYDQHYWIGLYRHQSSVIWRDGSALKFEHAFFDPNSIYSCVLATLRSFHDSVSLAFDNCLLKRHILCSFDLNNNENNRHNVPKTQPRSNVCSNGFKYYKDSCYKFINETETWITAKNKCSKFKNRRGIKGKLGYFKSFDHMNFVLSLINPSVVNRYLDPFVWIGYYRDVQSSNFISVGESHTDFQKSISLMDFPKDIFIGPNLAMSISSNPFINSEWFNFAEHTSLPYLCYIDPEPSYHPNTTYNDYEKHCPKDFNYLYNGNCYSILPLIMPFENAVKSCQSMHSNLLSIDNVFEEKYIHSHILDNIPSKHSFWLDLKLPLGGSLANWTTSSSKAPVSYTHWKHLRINNNMHLINNINTKHPRHYFKNCLAVDYSIPSFYNEYTVPDNNTDNTQYVESGMVFTECGIRLSVVCKRHANYNKYPAGFFNHSPQIMCLINKNASTSSNAPKHFLVQNSMTEDGEPCLRWDTVFMGVDTVNIIRYFTQTNLQVAQQLGNPHGYLSYGEQYCSRFLHDTQPQIIPNQRTTIKPGDYQCFVYNDGKFILKKCKLTDCQFIGVSHFNKFLAEMLCILFLCLGLSILFYVYRRNILGNYKVQACLVRVLGRNQPDWLVNRGPPPITTSSAVVMMTSSGGAGGTDDVIITSHSGRSGVGFVNPVYTPLAQESADKL